MLYVLYSVGCVLVTVSSVFVCDLLYYLILLFLCE